jgi:hypothetical protein
MLSTTDNGPGFTIPDLDNITAICPIEDTSACEELAGVCSRELGYYVDIVLEDEGLENAEVADCINALCCFCEKGASTHVGCTTQLELESSPVGAVSLNLACLLGPIFYGLKVECPVGD